MPAPIVLVHDEPAFLVAVGQHLRQEGFDVAAFGDPMKALDALSSAERIEVLITRVQFPAGKPHGVALANMARLRRRDLKVIFAALPEVAHHAEGLGTVLVVPVKPEQIAETVHRVLKEGSSTH